MINSDGKDLTLAELIRKGGIHYGLQGQNSREILENLISESPLPPSLSGEDLLRALMAREALMTTSVGMGAAIPHPRSPLITAAEDQFTAVGVLKTPVNWHKLDAEPVDIVILIVSASSNMQLRILSEIVSLCREENFMGMLRRGAREEKVFEFIEKMEKTGALRLKLN